MEATQRRRAGGLALIAGLILALVVPAMAVAATGEVPTIGPRNSWGATVDVLGGTYNSKPMATLDIVVVCDEMHYFNWDTGEEGVTSDGLLWADAILLQAHGRTIGYAQGYASQVPVTCDGSTINEVSLQVVAASMPLRRGDALAGVRIEVYAPYVESDGGTAQSGPTPIKLGR